MDENAPHLVTLLSSFKRPVSKAGIVVWSHSLLRDPEANLRIVRDKGLKLFAYTRTVSTRCRANPELVKPYLS
jgi:hypothetical protein